MPHTKLVDRQKYKYIVDQIRESLIVTKGDLEYLIYCCIARYMETREHTYTNLHEASYAAVHAGEEFKRLHLDRREDTAKDLNGEAYYEDEYEDEKF